MDSIKKEKTTTTDRNYDTSIQHDDQLILSLLAELKATPATKDETILASNYYGNKINEVESSHSKNTFEQDKLLTDQILCEITKGPSLAKNSPFGPNYTPNCLAMESKLADPFLTPKPVYVGGGSTDTGTNSESNEITKDSLSSSFFMSPSPLKNSHYQTAKYTHKDSDESLLKMSKDDQSNTKSAKYSKLMENLSKANKKKKSQKSPHYRAIKNKISIQQKYAKMDLNEKPKHLISKQISKKHRYDQLSSNEKIAYLKNKGSYMKHRYSLLPPNEKQLRNIKESTRYKYLKPSVKASLLKSKKPQKNAHYASLPPNLKAIKIKDDAIRRSLKTKHQRAKELEKRRIQYSVRTTVHGLSLLFSNDVMDAPVNKRLKSSIKKLSFLTDTVKTILKQDVGVRQHQIKLWHKIQPHQMAISNRGERRFIVELGKFIEQNQHDVELMRNLSTLSFIADYCIQVDANSSNPEFNQIVQTVKANYDRVEYTTKLVLTYMTNTVTTIIERISQPIRQHVNEPVEYYEARRIGGYQMHNYYSDGDNAIQNDYYTIGNFFPIIHANFHGLKIDDELRNNIEQEHASILTKFKDVLRNLMSGKEEERTEIIKDDANLLTAHEIMGTAGEKPAQCSTFQTALPITIQPELLTAQEIPSSNQKGQKPKNPISAIKKALNPTKVGLREMTEMQLHEYAKLVLDENNFADFGHGVDDVDIAKLWIAVAKSKETLVKLCDKTCIIPPVDWALRLRDSIRRMEGMNIDELMEYLPSLATCDLECCKYEDNATLDSNCKNMVKLIKRLKPCYQQLRTFDRYFRDLQKCHSYLTSYEEMVSSCDSLKMRDMATNPAVPQNIKRKLKSPLLNSEIHTEKFVQDSKGKIIRQFHTTMENTESHECFICQMFHYKKQMKAKPVQIQEIVKLFRASIYGRNNETAAIMDGRNLSDDVFVCRTCWKNVRERKMPTLAVGNGLLAVNPPQEITCLNWIEQILIQRVRAIQTLVTLKPLTSNYGNLKALKGGVLYMEVGIEETIQHVIDRLPNVSNLNIVVHGDYRKKFKNDYIVSMPKIFTALNWLKANNPFYQNIEIDEKFIIQDDMITFVEDPNCVLPDETDNYLLTLDLKAQGTTNINIKQPAGTALQQFTMKEMKGEKVKPYSENLDALAFVRQYPTGQFGKDYKNRDPKVSETKFIRNRLRNVSRQFMEPSYLLSLAYQRDLKTLNSSLHFMGKKARNLDQGAMLNAVLEGDHEIEATMSTFLPKFRGTESYWIQRNLELQSMIKTLGPPTLFITLNSAENSWQEVKDMYSTIHKLGPSDKISLQEMIEKDPGPFSRYFNKKVRETYKTFYNKDGPFDGEVCHHFVRIEYQNRGFPHCHGVVWMPKAPVIGRNTDEEVLSFIQKYITCRWPDQATEPELYTAVRDNQQHQHTTACERIIYDGKKGRTVCRFHFPREASEVMILNTELRPYQGLPGVHGKFYVLVRDQNGRFINDYNPTILLMWDGNMDIQFIASDTYLVVLYITDYASKAEKSSRRDLFEGINFSDTAAMRSIALQGLVQRIMGTLEACDRLHGHHLYQFDLTIRFLTTDTESRRIRMLKSKADLEEMNELGLAFSPFMNSFADVYYPHRPACFQQYGYFSCFMNLDAVPSARRKLPRNEDDSDRSEESDVHVEDEGEATIYGKDLFRADGYHTKNPHSPFYKFPRPESGALVNLQPGEPLSYLQTRAKPLLPRLWFKAFDETDPVVVEDYYRRCLMLFKPWVNENRLKRDDQSYEDAWREYRESIPAEYREDALADIDRLLNGYAEMDKKKIEERKKKVALRAHVEEYLDLIDEEDLINVYLEQVDQDLLEEQIRNLNARQTQVYNDLMNTMQQQEQQIQNCNCDNTMPCQTCTNAITPMRRYVTGKAGTGKSHVIDVIRKKFNVIYFDDYKDGIMRLALAAPTGLSAHNIKGFTIHSLLSLEVKHGSEAPYKALNQEKLQRLRKLFKKRPMCFIIDEVSMVSNVMLTKIHLRLCEIMGVHDQPFGGVNIIAVGDFLQLPPINSHFIFEQVTNKENSKLFNSLFVLNLWRTYFDYIELDQNMRQAGQQQFGDMLDRFRIASPTDADIENILTRNILVLNKTVEPKNGELPPAATMEQAANYFVADMLPKDLQSVAIFPKNEEADNFNNLVSALLLPDPMMLHTVGAEYTERDKKGHIRPYARKGMRTTDNPKKVIRDVRKRFIQRNRNKWTKEKTGGLEEELKIFEGCRIMLRRNIDVPRGLVNGAMGNIERIEKSGKTVTLLWVKFDGIDDIVKVDRVTANYNVSSTIQRTKRQFPVIVSYGITVHKCQGLTRDNVLAKLDKVWSTAYGLTYTAISRVRVFEGLHLMAFHPGTVLANSKCIDEYNRLRALNNMAPLEEPNVKPPIIAKFPKEKIVIPIEDFLGLKDIEPTVKTENPLKSNDQEKPSKTKKEKISKSKKDPNSKKESVTIISKDPSPKLDPATSNLDSIAPKKASKIKTAISRLGTLVSTATSKIKAPVKSNDVLEKLFLVKGNIINVPVECIVNAANPQLRNGGGVCGAIHMAAGPQLEITCQQLGGAATGDAKITPSYNIQQITPSIKNVIHAVGPNLNSLEQEEAVPKKGRGRPKKKIPTPEQCKQLKSCYTRSLDLTNQFGIKSIAFPCISTAIYGFPPDTAARLVQEAIKEWLDNPLNSNQIDKIVFCVLDSDKTNMQHYQSWFKKVVNSNPLNVAEFKAIQDQQNLASKGKTATLKPNRIQPLLTSKSGKTSDPSTNILTHVLPDAINSITQESLKKNWQQQFGLQRQNDCSRKDSNESSQERERETLKTRLLSKLQKTFVQRPMRDCPVTDVRFHNTTGTSCFINAPMQALRNCTELCTTFTAALNENADVAWMQPGISREKEASITRQYVSEIFSQRDPSSYNIGQSLFELTTIFGQYVSHRQDDAHDFMVNLVNDTFPDRCRQLFEFSKITTIECTNPGCGASTSRPSIEPTILAPVAANVQGNGESVDLQTLPPFTLDQRIPLGKDAKCDSCKSVGQLARTENLDLSTNKYLIYGLQIFKNFPDGRVRKVISNLENFNPDRVNIQGNTYRAIGAISHIGDDVNSGHYIARVRTANSAWINFNDLKRPKEDALPQRLWKESYNPDTDELDIETVYILLLEKISDATHNIPSSQDLGRLKTFNETNINDDTHMSVEDSLDKGPLLKGMSKLEEGEEMDIQYDRDINYLPERETKKTTNATKRLAYPDELPPLKRTISEENVSTMQSTIQLPKLLKWGGSLNGKEVTNTCGVDTFLSSVAVRALTKDPSLYKRIPKQRNHKLETALHNFVQTITKFPLTADLNELRGKFLAEMDLNFDDHVINAAVNEFMKIHDVLAKSSFGAEFRTKCQTCNKESMDHEYRFEITKIRGSIDLGFQAVLTESHLSGLNLKCKHCNSPAKYVPGSRSFVYRKPFYLPIETPDYSRSGIKLDDLPDVLANHATIELMGERYQLNAISLFHYPAPGGTVGHYTALVPIGQDWYHYDGLNPIQNTVNHTTSYLERINLPNFLSSADRLCISGLYYFFAV